MNESLYGMMLYGKNLYSLYRRSDIAAAAVISVLGAGIMARVPGFLPNGGFAGGAAISLTSVGKVARSQAFDGQSNIYVVSFGNFTSAGIRIFSGAAGITCLALGNLAYTTNLYGVADILLTTHASAEVYLGPYWIEETDDTDLWTPQEPETEIWINRPKGTSEFWIPRDPETELWVERPRGYEIWSEVPKNG